MADPKAAGKTATDTLDDAKGGLAGGRNPGALTAPGENSAPTVPIPPVGARKTFDEVQAEKNAKGDKSSLKIRIELDLDVEVHLTARVRGDITIGLL